MSALCSSPVLEATFGGGEANVSVSLASYGMDTAFVTVLPDNDITAVIEVQLKIFIIAEILQDNAVDLHLFLLPQ